MRLEMTPREYEPPSLCHTGIEELALLGGAAGASEAAAGAITAAEFSAAVGETAAAGGLFGSGIGLSEIGTVASLAGTGLQAKAQADQADYGEAVAKRQAEALRIKAGEDAASAQRQQIMQERRAGLITSRARALAADSGTLATSPTEVTNEQQIAGQGEYNALSSLYEGLASARADNYQADIDLFKARSIRAAAPMAIGGTLLSGLSQFAGNRARLKYLTSAGGDNSFFGLGR